MCGIAGLVYTDPSRPCDAETVLAMREVMPYRGPDDAGLHVEGPLGLGFRRLSIIDLGGGHQPMPGPGNRHWIVFNGEIYNYRDLRQELIAKGCTFRTHSDTEVILQLYAERGEACVQALNGMFAFAIWDSEHRTLFLARDRMGVKPLYYAETPEAFVFGSEIKTLFASGKVTPSARESALAEYLVFRQAAGCETMFRGVRSLPPGCTMTVQDGAVRVTRYWSPRPASPGEPIAFEAAAARLRELLEDSVRLRLISDVPVGTFCSGGVDSSLITALAVRSKGGAVNTFSIGFDDADYDESRYAEMVSKQYGTTHHALRVGNEEFSELFPTMVWHNDEPLDFANSVHIFALSRLAKRHVTVVLTGEGSDELFAGYPRYRIPQLAARWRMMPGPLRRLAAQMTGDHRLAKLDRYAAMSGEDAVLFNPSYLSRELVQDLAPSLMPLALAYRQHCLAEMMTLNLEPVTRTSLMDQESFLVAILNRQDKMSMAAAIESRVPFMDYRIVEFANSLPVACKLRNGSGKAIVKHVARELLPAEVVDRRKSGFGVPLANWFRSETGLGARVKDLPDSPAADVFNRDVLRRLVAEHRDGVRDHSEALWTALNLVTWKETFRC
jgi:asparagine synthase (glutamine-hydrolysing)